MRINRKKETVYLWIHIAIAACCLLFPLYRYVMRLIPERWLGCFVHDLLFLYCPLCGGTRAVASLLRLDIVGAFQCNAYVTLLCLVFLLFDMVAFIRLMRGKEVLLPVPRAVWIVLILLLPLYCILRNYLMIAYGIDPVGDLGVIWHR